MDGRELIFTTTSPHCGGEIVLTADRWQHTVEHHPEVEPYVEQVRLAIERPNLVYETRHRKSTLAFYARGLIDDHPYGGCYVAAFVRNLMEPPEVWTAYLPVRLSANPGKLLHATK